MGKLEDLRVERVDGVDRPATGHQWIVVKSEGQAEVEKDTAALAKTALESILKEEGLKLSGETVEALKALAAALDVEIDFAKADEEHEAPAAEAADESVEKDEADADAPVTRSELAGLVKEAMAEVIAEEIAALDNTAELSDDTPVEKAAKSKQADGQDEIEKSDDPSEVELRKRGRVSMADVIFDQ